MTVRSSSPPRRAAGRRRGAAASGQAHLALDSTRDVVSIEAIVTVVASADVEPALVDAYRARTGWAPGSRLALVCSVGHNPTMASWSEIEQNALEFALRVWRALRSRDQQDPGLVASRRGASDKRLKDGRFGILRG